MRSVNLTDMLSKLQEALSLSGAKLKALRDLKNDLAMNESNGMIAILRRLEQIESKIMATQLDLVKAATELSTRADSLSLKVDALLVKVQTLVTSLANVNLDGPATSALAAINASATTLAKEGDAVDAAVAALDPVLPTPAPAGTAAGA